MEEKMKKMFFLMLFLLILGAANVNSQVRIGGNGQPNPAAVLDLNADNTNNGTKGLALPRVSLVDINTPLTGSPTVSGMLVYNTSGSLSTGVYYWDDNKWVSVSDGTYMEKDSIIGNEVVDATPGRGLQRTGSGSTSSPYTLGVATHGIDTSMLARYSGTFIYGNAGPAGFKALSWVTLASVISDISANSTASYEVNVTGCVGPISFLNHTMGTSSMGCIISRYTSSPTTWVVGNPASSNQRCHVTYFCLK